MTILAFLLAIFGMELLFIFDWTGSGDWNIATALLLFSQWWIDAVIGLVFLIKFINLYRANHLTEKSL